MSKQSIDCLPILRVAQNEKLGLLGVTLEPGPQTRAYARLNFVSDNKHAAVAFAAGEGNSRNGARSFERSKSGNRTSSHSAMTSWRPLCHRMATR
jgi:hypothetical protein